MGVRPHRVEKLRALARLAVVTVALGLAVALAAGGGAVAVGLTMARLAGDRPVSWWAPGVAVVFAAELAMAAVALGWPAGRSVEKEDGRGPSAG